MNFLAQKRKSILLRESQAHQPAATSPFNLAYFKQLAQISDIGGWRIDFIEKKSYLDAHTRKTLNLPVDFKPSLRYAIDFYTPEYHVLALETYEACKEGQPFDLVFRMLTYDKVPFWARVIGFPLYDEEETITGMQIAIQNIDASKKRELQIEKMAEIAKSQNKQLMHLTQVMTQNMRSHAGNLELTLELLQGSNCPEEEKELIQNVEAISKSLNDSVDQLNSIITSQTKGAGNIQTIEFADVLKKVTSNLGNLIQNSETEIFSDFSEVPAIDYIPEYLENIFTQLISNALRFKHPKRNPAIDIFSFYEEDEVCLMIRDNGLGIDLNRFGNDMFKINTTFHNGSSGNGLGLFIVKNQVETLQGSLSIESCVNKGSTFRIRF